MNVYNTFFTTKSGERYEIGKYIKIGMYSIKTRKGEWRSEDQYYIRGFHLGGAGKEWAWIGMDGRMKGSNSEMQLAGNKLSNIVEKIKISKWDADDLRRMAGMGKKPRYVMGSDGYIWLPDFMIMDHPHKILMWALDPSYTHFKELHDAPPPDPFFPDWIPEEHGYEIV